MPDSRADDLIRHQERMASERAVFESHWREIAERILPRQDYFRTNRQPGDKHTERIFDSTASLALERFAAAMESMLTPRTQRWHKLRVIDEDLKEDPQVQAYLDQVTQILFSVRYSPRANFASQANECFMSLGAFGTSGMFIDDQVGHSIRYRSVSLSELFISENHQGVIDTVHRRFQLTARQAAQKFGEDKLSPRQKAALQTSPELPFDSLLVQRTKIMQRAYLKFNSKRGQMVTMEPLCTISYHVQ